VRPAIRAAETTDQAAEEPALPTNKVSKWSAELSILTVLAVVAALYLARTLLIPLVLGVLASYALEPAVAFLVRRRVPRVISAGLVLVALCGTGGWFAYQLSDEASRMVEQLPVTMRRVRLMIGNAQTDSGGAVSRLNQAATEIERTTAETTKSSQPTPGVTPVEIVEPPLRVRDYLWWGSMGAAALAAQLTLLLFFVFFLLASGDLFKRKFVKIAGPSLKRRRVAVKVLDEINEKIANFLLYLLVTCIIVGVATGLAFHWLGVQHAALWGVAAGALNTVSYFGPVVVAVAAAVSAFVQFSSMQTALVVAGIAMAITTAEGYLLTPFLMGKATRMNGVVVFVGVMFWGWLWGVWGAVLAVPMLVVFKTVADHIEDLKPLSELLGE
jgi:predicted PurR-regulated permease PerM